MSLPDSRAHALLQCLPVPLCGEDGPIGLRKSVALWGPVETGRQERGWEGQPGTKVTEELVPVLKSLRGGGLSYTKGNKACSLLKGWEYDGESLRKPIVSKSVCTDVGSCFAFIIITQW